MALTQITYNDKSNYQSSSLANEYKVSASDMNEIKSVVNGACTQVDNSISYSTTETKVGAWIDGKPIYRKVVNFGALPNATSKSVAHNISNIAMITNIRGVALNPSTNTYLPLPYTTTTATQNLQLYANLTNITANTGFNLSIYTTTYIILEYTKTTD